ncbi:uncharacterized protein LOC113866293 [Abrus precatorius]|uniref:Uncharacterized protein LOC113866293 n=1 Tax=Abrus precatorius TaxID=3816 RepID=A0A8B8LL39_ABRPR|nr:uncharacterized protein LOC113866293 [Abrus precatorius]
MASSQLQNDKGNGMRRFQRKRNFENIFNFFKLCSVVLFIFSNPSCFPLTSQSLSHLHALFAPLFHNSLYAFLLLNTIILFLYAFSNKTNNVADSTNVYRQFINHAHSRPSITASQEQPRILEPSHVGDSSSSSSSSSPVYDETVAAVTETTTCCTTVSTVSDKKRYPRARSENFERRMVVATQPELKRFNTGLKGKLKSKLRDVEQLSKEEFNRAVEDFIAKHKRMQLEEHIGSQKTEYLTIMTQ